LVPPRSTPITQSAATSATIHRLMAHDPQPPGSGGERPQRPKYRVYRSRPRWFKAPGRAGEPGFDELRELRGAGRREPGRARKPWTGRRAARWALAAIGGWLALSLLLFLISAQIESSKVSDEAKKALDGGGFTLTSTSTILVLGSDARPPRARDCPVSGCGAPRSDTIMLMRVGPAHSTRLSIPRDTIVDIPGHGPDKINAAYAIGGAALTITTVKQYLGIQVNHLVEVNFDNFPSFVDALGGIDFTDGCVISNISGGTRNGGFTLRLTPGTNHLDGRQALTLARTRKNECHPGEDDITRVKRQQQILNAIKSRLTSPTTFFRLPLVSWDAPKAVRTDMGGFTLMQLFVAAEIGGSAPTDILKPTGASVIDGQDALVATSADVRRHVRKLMTGH
jgi:LCP family protein required for cell wall assembly